jgi:TRAP-type C4-dicarboxylate transport system permease small subunit
VSRFLDRLASALARLARWMNLAAGWLFVVCAVFITAEVLARNFLGFSTQSTTELSGYMLAVGIAWGLANALAERAHVRIDIFINKLPAGPRQHLHAVALVFLLAFAVAMAYGAWYITNESIEFRAADMTGLRTPLAIPQGLWGFGIVVFACLCLVLLARAVLLLARGRGDEVDRLLGSRTYQDEAREVLDAVGKGERP